MSVEMRTVFAVMIRDMEDGYILDTSSLVCLFKNRKDAQKFASVKNSELPRSLPSIYYVYEWKVHESEEENNG